MATQNAFLPKGHCEEEHWISVSDMMAGLMMIFLFIAITYIRPIQTENDHVREIAVAFNDTENELYKALKLEFKGDLQKWGAELDRKTLSVRFRAPDILFDAAQVTLKEKFKIILADFFPRYVAVLWEFRETIEEVRIEGHTSSEWSETSSRDEAYFKNMRLSQGRTRQVLAFGLMLPDVGPFKGWLARKLTANGLSSSQLVVIDGEEAKELSRRVEFRARTNAKQQMVRILETAR
jgi:outer membrane protein OmpA-like peptidoglycan-associated protein